MKKNELNTACSWISKTGTKCILEEWNANDTTDCESCPFNREFMTREQFEEFKQKIIDSLQK